MRVLARAELARLPAADTLVLTVNNRLARQLVAELAGALEAAQVTELPRIVPLARWFSDAADALAFVVPGGNETETAAKVNTAAPLATCRLDAFASELLWRDAIAACEHDRPLLNVALAARLAQDADRLSDDWQLRVPEQMQTSESQCFALWRAAYRQRLRDLDAADANSEVETVLAALAAGHVAVPPQVVLAGFAEISPRLQRLIAALQQRGACCQTLVAVKARPESEPETTPKPPLRWQASDHHAEWQAAADWAAQQLRAHPERRYAIVAASLADDAPLARRTLARTLRAADGQRYAFNVAVGRPLAEWPAVRAALAWLQVLVAFDRVAFDADDGRCPAAVLGRALLAGHCEGEWRDGQSPDSRAHATLDTRWRRQQRSHLSHADWTQELAACPQLARGWDAARAAWQQPGAAAQTNTTDLWASRYRAALAALGFPGERTLDTLAFQVCTAFDALLLRYAALSRVAGPRDAGGALALLADLAHATPFQPSRDPHARLDVLGLLEAEGGRWDGVWALGLSDEVLPANPKPNPLIPLAVLRAANAPRATPERERQWACERYAALIACAPQVIVSHPASEGERALRPAPLIAALPRAAALNLSPTPSPPTPLPPAGEGSQVSPPIHGRGGAGLAKPGAGEGCHETGTAILETLDDDIGLPLDARSATAGGLDVLETQARNPLWAYVRHRLGARALPDYADAADPRARGRFLHAALERLAAWLPDQTRVLAATPEERAARISEAIAAAAQHTLADWPSALRALESARAQNILALWLQSETERAPWAVVALEQALTWQHGAPNGNGTLTLTVRLDRIDRLADGRLAVIDYKTGSRLPNPLADWSRARPVSLQLPFYAAVLGQAGPDPERPEVAALVLAQLHARAVGFAGVADGEVGIASLRDAAEVLALGMTMATEERIEDHPRADAWHAVQTRWQRTITTLAEEYAAGLARNTTLRHDDLQYCDALAFLRVGESL